MKLESPRLAGDFFLYRIPGFAIFPTSSVLHSSLALAVDIPQHPVSGFRPQVNNLPFLLQIAICSSSFPSFSCFCVTNLLTKTDLYGLVFLAYSHQERQDIGRDHQDHGQQQRLGKDFPRL